MVCMYIHHVYMYSCSIVLFGLIHYVSSYDCYIQFQLNWYFFFGFIRISCLIYLPLFPLLISFAS